MSSETTAYHKAFMFSGKGPSLSQSEAPYFSLPRTRGVRQSGRLCRRAIPSPAHGGGLGWGKPWLALARLEERAPWRLLADSQRADANGPHPNLSPMGEGTFQRMKRPWAPTTSDRDLNWRSDRAPMRGAPTVAPMPECRGNPCGCPGHSNAIALAAILPTMLQRIGPCIRLGFT